MAKHRRALLAVITIVCCCINMQVAAQSLLDKRISIEANHQRLADVLKLLSNKGGFYFSYNSAIIVSDSIVSFSISNKTVKQALDQFCGSRYRWQQSNNYIILRKAPITAPAVESIPKPTVEKQYIVTGIVLNAETGEKVRNASIYQKQQLQSAMSDDNGYFKIKLKSRYSTASLTISREFFEDTTITIQPKFDQQVTIVMMPVDGPDPVVTISPVENELPDTIVIKPPTDTLAAMLLATEEVNLVEKTRWAKRLLSAKQNIQSINLKKFFADRTVQLSLLPGLGTQGKLSAQVVDNFSVNVLGGYTAGVNGVELGGLFNINKLDVKYLQAAGLLNVTGGNVTGAQFAGLHNNVLKNMEGVQASGISNYVHGNVSGAQFAGVYNHVQGNVDGIQASGIANYVKGNVNGVQLGTIHNHVGGSFSGLQASHISNFVKGKFTGVQLSNIHNVCFDSVVGVQASTIVNFAHKQVSGVQLSAIGNFANRELRGAQLGTIFNYAKNLRGLQIGLINVSDTSAGYSIGLINIVFKGIHKLAISTNEALDYNAAFKTGNSKLYSILLVGFDRGTHLSNGDAHADSSFIYSFGYGLGHEFSVAKWFSLNPEYTVQHLHYANKSHVNIMNRFTLQFNFKLGKYVSLFGGPTFAFHYANQDKLTTDPRVPLPPSYHTFNLWDNDVKGWFGWNAGISIF